MGRVGFATGPLYQPYGIDAGNGSGFGAVVGFKVNDLYIGGETSLIFNPTSGLLTQSNDMIWTTGLALKKQFDGGSLGIFVGLNLANGEYNCTTEQDGIEYTETGSYSNQCVWEAGFEGSWYLPSTSTQFVLKGGTYVLREDQKILLVHPHAQIGLKFLL